MRPFGIATAAALAWAVVACKAGPRLFPDTEASRASPIRVAFLPPERTPIVEQLSTTRVEGPDGGTEVQTVHATLTSTFERAGDGWLLTQKLSDVRAEREGAGVESPFLALMTRFPIKLRLAKDGAFVRLANPEDAEAAIRATFPDPEQAAIVLRYLTPEAIEKQAKLEWNGKYGDLLGREVLPGHAWYAWEAVPLAGGAELGYVLERKLLQARPSDGGRELVIALSCPNSPEAAANSVAMRALLESRDELAMEQTVACTGEQVIGLDPFVPRSIRLELTAAPKDPSGGKRPLAMTRTMRTQEPLGIGVRKQEVR
jgi:hypothetical protein